ncbi:ribosome-recycling factor [Buchnera aphidicola (Nipponaphis monzeni)]|uniref:Ribosome-recycling factor n=1 Tax=Buchnera aphidicola (Nipponaphis monzeni) TaxID=2495405 RepID=A0A455TA44_9GAMM|nr:ribosome recycling factor [Buchnera aphidicola]BBI01198.1 ribosome-recycling factor [Buchnera aphidicola (Nipponaphis monzeni)]
MINEIRKDIINKMDRCINLFMQDINTIRTNKVFPELLAGINVSYYGKKTSLLTLANVTVQDTSVLKVNVFDPSINKLIEKSIKNANLGFNCFTKGDSIHVSVPKLTEERRKELIKLVKKSAQKHRVHIRNIRREANVKSKTCLKDKIITKDKDYEIQSIVQKLTNDYVKKIDNILLNKERSLMEI